MLILSLLLSSSITLSGCGESHEEKKVKKIVESTFNSNVACKDIENKTNGFYNDNMDNHIFLLNAAVDALEEGKKTYNNLFDGNTLLYTYPSSAFLQETGILCTSESYVDKECLGLLISFDARDDDIECFGTLREFIINNNIECVGYKLINIDGAYIDFNQYMKDNIIYNYGSEIWEYLKNEEKLVIPIFSLNDIYECIKNYGLLEQELEIEFYEKDNTKISIKVNDDYQDVYSNYFLYSCGEDLTISDQEDIVIVEEEFRNNGIEGEVQLLGTLKDYILENEIKASEYRYEAMEDADGQIILDTYGEETYNYYKEKGYPIICFDSENLYETYRNSLTEDEPIFLQLK